MPLLNDQAFLRYQRQIALEDIGETGQYELKKKQVLIVGCGGLGTGVSLYLTGAGIGSIVLVDHDEVEVSNLHRQIAYRESDVGKKKVSALSNQLRGLNHECRIRTIGKKLNSEQLRLEVMLADVVIDCSDNFPTRHQVNQICYQQKTTLVSASAIGWDGQLSVYRYRDEEPCYRCLVDDEVSDSYSRCSESGVFGPVVGAIASLQALQVIRELLAGMNESHHEIQNKPSLKANDFFHFDGKEMQLRSFRFEKDMNCPVCGDSVDKDAHKKVES